MHQANQSRKPIKSLYFLLCDLESQLNKHFVVIPDDLQETINLLFEKNERVVHHNNIMTNKYVLSKNQKENNNEYDDYTN